MEKKKLTIEILNQEYNNWIKKFGPGRNKDDLRFGQYLHINYDIDSLFTENNQHVNDGFYTESAYTVYDIFVEKL